MQTRKEQLFSARATQAQRNVIPATVQFIHDKAKGLIKPLSAEAKMLCALRKVLAQMSDKHPGGCRYYIAGNKVEVTSPPASTDNGGDAQSYRASGRCRLGVCHPGGHATTVFVEFTISFRDITDDRGLADVQFMDPTTIDILDRAGPVNLAHLQ